MSLDKQYQRLRNLLKSYGSVAVAFSGGVDSTLLLKVALDCLGRDKVVALTAVSPLFPDHETEACKDLAMMLGTKHILIEEQSLTLPELLENGPQRCYHCKKHLFVQLLDIQRQTGMNTLVEGSNLDDLDDYRPGRKALQELNVASPLLECQLTKKAIRTLSQQFGLPTWDRPALACLASRVPYGIRLDGNLLKQIEHCEDWLRSRGFHQYRVRYHQQIARIEIQEQDFPRVLNPQLRMELLIFFKENGFDYVTLDLQGYRSGSLNEVISTK